MGKGILTCDVIACEVKMRLQQVFPRKKIKVSAYTTYDIGRDEMIMRLDWNNEIVTHRHNARELTLSLDAYYERVLKRMINAFPSVQMLRAHKFKQHKLQVQSRARNAR